MKKLYFLLAILTATLFATYDPINENEVLIINGAFHGKYDDYAYFEIESYGKYIKANYSESNRKYINEWKDYLSYIDFLEKYLFPTKKYNSIKGKDKITPEIFAFAEREREIERERERERLAKLEAEINSKAVKIGNLMFQDFDLPNRMNWNDAVNYCKNLNLLDFKDWRLPELEELRIAYQNQSKFKNIKNNWYWSNTIYERYTSNSWVVDFNDGDDRWFSHSSNLDFIVCV